MWERQGIGKKIEKDAEKCNILAESASSLVWRTRDGLVALPNNRPYLEVQQDGKKNPYFDHYGD
jgi:hypothetical protein